MKKTIAAAILSTIALCGCSEEKLPSTFQTTSKTTIGGETVYTARDTGTGCEIIVTSDGIMPRNERAADGVTVKQRCVVTGDEQPATVVETTSTANGAGQPAFAPRTQAATREDVLRAVQGAVRDRQQTIPPASAPAIPPPRGPQRQQPVAPADDGGVESQLK